MTGPLGHRRFRVLVGGRAVSMLGNAMAPVAIAFAVLDLTGSAAALGIVLAARSIPQVLFMLASGVIADRFDRARVLDRGLQRRLGSLPSAPGAAGPALPCVFRQR